MVALQIGTEDEDSELIRANCADDDAKGGAEEASRRTHGAGLGAATLRRRRRGESFFRDGDEAASSEREPYGT